jgi:GNAT superfamily N-acetyltransferase
MSVEIVRGASELLDELEPLWLALVAHHREVAPQLGAVRPDAESWAMRRTQYEQWLAERRAFVVLARDEGAQPIGYAFVAIEKPGPTWPGNGELGWVETLSVHPDARGRGIGPLLLDRVEAELATIGIHELQLDAIASNDGALRFYERERFEPVMVILRRRRVS